MDLLLVQPADAPGPLPVGGPGTTSDCSHTGLSTPGWKPMTRDIQGRQLEIRPAKTSVG
jgi:hypothetical protein